MRSGDITKLDPLIDALALANQHGMLVFLKVSSAFHDVLIRVSMTEGDKSFHQQKFVTSEQLREHGTDAMAYVISTAVGQLQYERQKYLAHRRT